MTSVAIKGARTESGLQAAWRCSWRPIPAYPVDSQTPTSHLSWLFTPWDSLTLDWWPLLQLKVPELNLAFKQPEDAVDDPFQHTQWIPKHQLHISHVFFPLGMVWALIDDLCSNQRCQTRIWHSSSLKMRLTTHSSIPCGFPKTNFTSLMIIYPLG